MKSSISSLGGGLVGLLFSEATIYIAGSLTGQPNIPELRLALDSMAFAAGALGGGV